MHQLHRLSEHIPTNGQERSLISVMLATTSPGPGIADPDSPRASYFCAFKDNPDFMKGLSSVERRTNSVRRKGILRAETERRERDLKVRASEESDLGDA